MHEPFTMNVTKHSSYRPDIDGLRAVAVGSVLLFHAFPNRLPGGFVGVDVFFVISGFLISGLIYDSLQKGTFSYAQFYARRIRRIFPALVTVVAVTLAVGAWLYLPREYRELGREALAGIGFYANLLFWNETGYFDAAHQLKPLLHLWSLGVEEQFYITWPLILAFLYPRTRWLPWIVGALALASFGLNLASTNGISADAFYLPMPRYWELLIGAVLAYPAAASAASVDATGTTMTAAAPRRARIELFGVAGAALIGASVFLLNETQPFPGWRALLPTVGACCIIAARGSWINRKVLAHPVAVFIGLISYPLYLWHWAILCGLQHKLVYAATGLERLAAMLLSVLLAWLTYIGIEKAFRFRGSARARVTTLAGLAVLVAFASVLVIVSDGAAFRYPAQIRRLATLNYDAARDYREGVCQIDHGGPFSELGSTCIDPATGRSHLLVLWGDSHASSLYQGLRSLQARQPGLRIAQFTAAGCPPLLGLSDTQRQSCSRFNSAAFARIEQLHPDVVVMEGFWDSHANVDGVGAEETELKLLQATVKRLATIGIPRVVVFGDLPRWEAWQPDAEIEIWRKYGRIPERSFEYFAWDSANLDILLGKALQDTSAVFVSPINLLCNPQGCLLAADGASGMPVAWDASHLTAAGSRLLVGLSAERIFGSRPPLIAPSTP